MNDYSRDRQLDMLRGLAVVGMFFYSVIASLARQLPPVLEHNIPGKLRIGDFVLSLFLFSSGMSLAILRNRYDSLWAVSLWRSVGRRLGMMLFASAFITPFSTGTFGGMDEVMLNATLTIPTLLLARGSVIITAGLFTCLSALYYALPQFGITVIQSNVYLGGYQGAVFFLPVLTAGATLRNSWRDRARRHAIMWGVVSIALYALSGTPDKLVLTPSYIALSCFVSTSILWALGYFALVNNVIEYFGRYSLRMWCLMFVLIAPARLYAETSLHAFQLTFQAWQAVIIAIAWMSLCYALSKGWDALGTMEKAVRASRKSR